MGKKKRKKKYYGYPRSNSKNSHHLLWQRREWNRGAVNTLRSHPYCIVEIPAQTLHVAIHEGMQGIPVPSQDGAKRVLWHLHYLGAHGGISDHDPIEKRLKVLIALFDYSEQPTADALKLQLEIVTRFNG